MSVAEMSVAEMSWPKRPWPKCPWVDVIGEVKFFVKIQKKNFRWGRVGPEGWAGGRAGGSDQGLGRGVGVARFGVGG